MTELEALQTALVEPLRSIIAPATDMTQAEKLLRAHGVSPERFQDFRKIAREVIAIHAQGFEDPAGIESP